MSNKRSLRFLLVLLFAAFSSAALLLADAGAAGQNANSSTTEEGAAEANANAGMSAPRRGRGRRRAPVQIVNEITVIAPVIQDDDSRGDLSGEKVDLSGTYSGNLSTAGGSEVGNGSATLTINGESFTLTTEGGANHSGRFYAVLTRGAISAALYFPSLTDSATSTPVVYNVRARKSGERLTLTPAPQTKARLTFRPGR